MQKRNRKPEVLIIVLMVPVLLLAQNNTNSPYSRYGVGEVFQKPFGSHRGLSGTTIGMRIPNTINFFNPASYSSQDSLSFIFDFGLRYSSTIYKTSELEVGIDNLNIDHIAISFPIYKWWYGSVGILPYSNVGYKIVAPVSVPNDNLLANSYYQGSGGLNQFYIGNAIIIKNSLSLGVNFSYLFGSIEHNREIFYFNNGRQDSSFLYSEEIKKTAIRDLKINMGAQYTYRMNKNSYTLGLIYDNQSNLRAREDKVLVSKLSGVFYEVDDGRMLVTDTSYNIQSKDEHIVFPAKYGIGFSFNHDNKLILGIDYSMQEWSKYQSLSKNDSLQNSQLFTFGIQYTPNYKSISSYLERIDYRFGIRYYDTYLKLYDTDITDYSLSVGLGLPLKNRKSKLNISYEYGRRGTTINDLIQEDYHLVSFSLSLYDNWFQKSKID